ncbi:methyltransferase [Legionella norrlandica]|uniref:Methyltransferase n=1 Tax=Legionella norrlandica TaxID=1498499 RepID=A0A0A2SRH5_9GAMM|nr:tetratricopeptide repeat protein [Legionella norrlandica]KGP63337.1 methyltransferase [Legionella norrlandica]
MNGEIETLFAQAYKLQYEGQLPQAISLYEKILSRSPKHIDSLHFLGLTYAQLGDMENAILYFLQARTLNSKDTALLNNLANAYKKSGQLEEAIKYYQQAIEINPKYAQAHNNLATIHALQNNYLKALHHYATAVNIEPDFSAAHFNLGLLLLQNNQLSAAKTQFNNVIVLNPNHIEAQFYLGILYLEDNLLIEAEQAFRKVLEHDREHVQSLINLGVVALKREQNQLAVDYFTKALALDNEDIDARNNLAATFMHHDRFENALMHYDVLLKKEPNNIEYLYNSGVAQMALGHLNEAIILFEQILHLQKDHAPSLNNLAAIYLRMEKRDTARDYLKQALAINPQDKVSQHMLNAITGETCTDTTEQYAQNLFNNYALYYDQHMQGQLHYTIPHHIGRLVHRFQLLQVNNVLDLGCGTGLTGTVLREISKHLTGVDISEKMIARAKEKGIYDLLVCSELIDFLKKDNKYYDLAVAADVLPYFGDLENIFNYLQQRLNQKGFFIFTTEISAATPWKLESSARFSHLPEYIEELIHKYQFQLVEKENIPGRTQNKQVLEIMLYAIQKSTS